MEHRDSLTNSLDASSGRNQHLTFTVGQEEYGIDILTVQEIRGFSSVTPVPNAPSYVKGVMNLRGTIIPVVDLQSRLVARATTCTPFSVIIVVLVQGKATGLIVDAVSDVVGLPPGDIRDVPDFGDYGSERFLRGLTQVGNKLVLLLDLEKVLGQEVITLSAAMS